MTDSKFVVFKNGKVSSGDWVWAVGLDTKNSPYRIVIANLTMRPDPFQYPGLVEVRTPGMSVFEEMALRMAGALNCSRPEGDTSSDDYPWSDWEKDVADEVMGEAQ
jgi:hypothetical protein